MGYLRIAFRESASCLRAHEIRSAVQGSCQPSWFVGSGLDRRGPHDVDQAQRSRTVAEVARGRCRATITSKILEGSSRQGLKRGHADGDARAPLVRRRVNLATGTQAPDQHEDGIGSPRLRWSRSIASPLTSCSSRHCRLGRRVGFARGRLNQLIDSHPLPRARASFGALKCPLKCRRRCS